MAQKKFVVGCFDDEAVLFPAVKQVRTAGYKIKDVYTPFAVHGLDQLVLFMVSLVPLQQSAQSAGSSQKTGL